MNRAWMGAILGCLCAAVPALALEAPRFDIERECKSLPLESARIWCLREERRQEKWLGPNWSGAVAGVSRDTAAACVAIASAAQTYRYWTLRHCIAPAPENGAAPCE